MNRIAAFADAHRDPLALLREVHGHALDALVALGLGHAKATQLQALAELYCGPSTYPDLVEDTIAAITARGVSLFELEDIEAQAATAGSSLQAWRTRRALARGEAAPDTDADTAGEDGEKKKRRRRTPLSQATVYRRGEDDYTLALRGDADTIDRLYRLVKGEANPADYLLRGGGAAVKVFHVHVKVDLPDATTVLDGTDDETLFECTDGIARTSRQLATQLVDPALGIMLYHRLEGPVDLLRTQRLPNLKQRLLANLENTTCAWDGCNIPALDAQIHHMDSWQLGGHTDMINLATACPRHNGVNDDDPRRTPVYGRLERTQGKILRVFSFRRARKRKRNNITRTHIRRSHRRRTHLVA